MLTWVLVGAGGASGSVVTVLVLRRPSRRRLLLTTATVCGSMGVLSAYPFWPALTASVTFGALGSAASMIAVAAAPPVWLGTDSILRSAMAVTRRLAGTVDWYGSTRDEETCCAADSYDPRQPQFTVPRKVIKGGSFLCADSYCMRYRPAARRPQQVDTGMSHIGFRCITRQTDGLTTLASAGTAHASMGLAKR